MLQVRRQLQEPHHRHHRAIRPAWNRFRQPLHRHPAGCLTFRQHRRHRRGGCPAFHRLLRHHQHRRHRGGCPANSRRLRSYPSNFRGVSLDPLHRLSKEMIVYDVSLGELDELRQLPAEFHSTRTMVRTPRDVVCRFELQTRFGSVVNSRPIKAARIQIAGIARILFEPELPDT